MRKTAEKQTVLKVYYLLVKGTEEVIVTHYFSIM